MKRIFAVFAGLVFLSPSICSGEPELLNAEVKKEINEIDAAFDKTFLNGGRKELENPEFFIRSPADNVTTFFSILSTSLLHLGFKEQFLKLDKLGEKRQGTALILKSEVYFWKWGKIPDSEKAKKNEYWRSYTKALDNAQKIAEKARVEEGYSLLSELDVLERQGKALKDQLEDLLEPYLKGEIGNLTEQKQRDFVVAFNEKLKALRSNDANILARTRIIETLSEDATLREEILARLNRSAQSHNDTWEKIADDVTMAVKNGLNKNLAAHILKYAFQERTLSFFRTIRP